MGVSSIRTEMIFPFFTAFSVFLPPNAEISFYFVEILMNKRLRRSLGKIKPLPNAGRLSDVDFLSSVPCLLRFLDL